MNRLKLMVCGIVFFSAVISGMESLRLDSLDLNLSWEEGVLQAFKYCVDEDRCDKAIEIFNTEKLRALEQCSGVDENNLYSVVDSSGNSFLHYLSSVSIHTSDAYELALQLTAAGYSVDRKNNKRQTPLHCAVDIGNKALCAFLIQKNPALLKEADDNGRLPLHVAAENKSPMMIEWLMNNGCKCDVLVEDNNGKSCVSILLDSTRYNSLEDMRGLNSWKLDKEIFSSLAEQMLQQDLVKTKEMALAKKKQIEPGQQQMMYNSVVVPMNRALKRLRSSVGEGGESQQSAKRICVRK